MTTYVALLRAINVGGTGRLAMTDLRLLCAGCGFRNVVTYIQSGNVVFQSRLSEGRVKAVVDYAPACCASCRANHALYAREWPSRRRSRATTCMLSRAQPTVTGQGTISPSTIFSDMSRIVVRWFMAVC